MMPTNAFSITQNTEKQAALQLLATKYLAEKEEMEKRT